MVDRLTPRVEVPNIRKVVHSYKFFDVIYPHSTLEVIMTYELLVVHTYARAWRGLEKILENANEQLHLLYIRC